MAIFVMICLILEVFFQNIMNYHQTELFKYHNKQIDTIHQAVRYVNQLSNNICAQIYNAHLFFSILSLKSKESQSIISAFKTAL